MPTRDHRRAKNIGSCTRTPRVWTTPRTHPDRPPAGSRHIGTTVTICPPPHKPHHQIMGHLAPNGVVRRNQPRCRMFKRGKVNRCPRTTARQDSIFFDCQQLRANGQGGKYPARIHSTTRQATVPLRKAPGSGAFRMPDPHARRSAGATEPVGAAPSWRDDTGRTPPRCTPSSPRHRTACRGPGTGI